MKRKKGGREGNKERIEKQGEFITKKTFPGDCYKINSVNRKDVVS